MNTSEAPELTPEQKRWAFAGSAIFLTAVGFLGVAVAQKLMLPFAIGWVALQIFGYVGALRMSKGEIAHPLFKSQVMLNVIVLTLLLALFMKAA